MEVGRYETSGNQLDDSVKAKEQRRDRQWNSGGRKGRGYPYLLEIDGYRSSRMEYSGTG